MYRVSYYVPDEKYWQFAGQFESKGAAIGRINYLRRNGSTQFRLNGKAYETAY